jgi:hypothetical protein
MSERLNEGGSAMDESRAVRGEPLGFDDRWTVVNGELVRTQDLSEEDFGSMRFQEDMERVSGRTPERSAAEQIDSLEEAKRVRVRRR